MKTEAHASASGYGTSEYEVQGLTKREHFAAMAMQGLCATPYPINRNDIAAHSIMMADALITALNK